MAHAGNGASPPPPHEIQINLGSMCNVGAFQYLPRQDGSPNGRIAQFEFYVSLDGVNWGTAVATGTLANVATEQWGSRRRRGSASGSER